jgi:hypothetical protein
MFVDFGKKEILRIFSDIALPIKAYKKAAFCKNNRKLPCEYVDKFCVWRRRRDYISKVAQ